MVIKGVVNFSKKWSKDGKTFNTVEIGVVGIGSMQFTVDERIVPDFIEGETISLDLGIGASKGKPYVKPDWGSLQVINNN